MARNISYDPLDEEVDEADTANSTADESLDRTDLRTPRRHRVLAVLSLVLAVGAVALVVNSGQVQQGLLSASIGSTATLASKKKCCGKVLTNFGVGPCRGYNRSHNPWGEWYTAQHRFKGTLQDCKNLCLADGKCKAMEYSQLKHNKLTYCELWHKEPLHTDPDIKGFTCYKKQAVRPLDCEACKHDMSPEEYCKKKDFKPAGCEAVEPACCRAMTVECLSCAAKQSPEEYCKERKFHPEGCSKLKPTPKPHKPTPRPEPACCRAKTAECFSCAAKQSPEEFCKDKDYRPEGCSKFKPAPKPHKPTPRPEPVCCRAKTAECLSCAAKQSPEEFCKDKDYRPEGCSKFKPTPKPHKPTPRPAPVCCRAKTATCLSCAANQSTEEFCKDKDYRPEGCSEFKPRLRPTPRPTRSPTRAPTENRNCCHAMTADCLACKKGMSAQEYCDMLANDEKTYDLFLTTDGCGEYLSVA